MQRRFQKVAVAAVAVGVGLGSASVAHAAAKPIEKQYKTPTENSSPNHITNGSDGNLWFTEAPEFGFEQNIGRITPTGDITEFPACDSCFPNDIVQGPNNVLYYTNNDNLLGRMTTDGQSLAPRSEGLFVGGNRLDANGNDIWVTDGNRDLLWHYDVTADDFTSYPVPGADPNPGDIAVEADGTVWFTQSGPNAIVSFEPGQFDAANPTAAFTQTMLPPGQRPRSIAIANDALGTVWYTRIVNDQVGRVDPNTRRVTEFTVGAGTEPAEIAAAADGTMWFTQSFAGNAAQINFDGVIINESRMIKDSEPEGITVAPNGDPWYTDNAGSNIVQLILK